MAEGADGAEGVVAMAFGGEGGFVDGGGGGEGALVGAGVFVGEAMEAELGGMVGGDAVPEADALVEVADVVSEAHGEAEGEEFVAGFVEGDTKGDGFAVELFVDGGFGLLGELKLLEAEEAAERTGEGAKAFAVVTGDGAAVGDFVDAGGDAVEGPAGHLEGEFEEVAEHGGVASFAPEKSADFSVDVGGDEGGDGGVVGGKAEGEVVFELLGAEIGQVNELAVLKDGEEAEGVVAELDEPGTGRGRWGLTVLQKGSSVPDLFEDHGGLDPGLP